jgi:hypothetical protein
MAGLGLSLMALTIVQPVGAADTPATAIAMDSPAGQKLLLKPRTRRADYAALVQWYETQANLAYCGVASSVMVLNSLAVAAPKA